MREIVTTVLSVLDQSGTGTGNGGDIDTIGARDRRDSSADFYLSCSSLLGTSPTVDVSVTTTVGGVTFTIGTFTQLIAASTEKITVANCPSVIKIVYTAGGTVSDFDCDVTCVRF